jgi:hypothetical protein
LARRIDGIAKQGLTGTMARPLELFNQSTSIVIEAIEVRKRRDFLVDSRAKIFNGLAIGA